MTVEPGSSVVTPVRFFRRYDYPDQFYIRVDGKRSANPILLKNYGRAMQPDGFVLESIAMAGLCNRVEDHVTGSTSSGSRTSSNLYATSLDVARWGEEWLYYSGNSLTSLNASEWNSLKPKQQEALLEWVQSGGHLFLFGDDGNLIRNRLTLKFTQFGALIRAFHGFGSVVCVPLNDMEQLKPSHLYALHNLIQDKGFKLAQSYGGGNRSGFTKLHERFPIVENLNIPIRAFFILLLVFLIVIGPLNYWYMKRRNQRVMVVVTIPLLSLSMTLCLVAYAFFSEGIAVRHRQEAVTILDQVKQEATTLGTGVLYAPIASRVNLFFHADTEITPLLSNNSQIGGVIDLTRGQELKNGWVRSRQPFYYQVRKIETRRERLNVSPVGDAFEIVNGLGGTIRELYLVDNSGRVFDARAVEAGSKALLQASKVTISTTEPEWYLFYGLDMTLEENGWKPLFEASNNGMKLRPGFWMAVLDSAPFMEMKGHKSVRTSSLVIGNWEAP